MRLYWSRVGPESDRTDVLGKEYLCEHTHTHTHTHPPIHTHSHTHSYTHTLSHTHTHLGLFSSVYSALKDRETGLSEHPTRLTRTQSHPNTPGL